MATVRVERLGQKKVTLGATLTRIAAGDDVRIVWLSCDSAVRLVYSDTLDDGDAAPADYHLIPAGVQWPIEVGDKRPLIAADSSTPTATLWGQS